METCHSDRRPARRPRRGATRREAFAAVVAGVLVAGVAIGAPSGDALAVRGRRIRNRRRNRNTNRSKEKRIEIPGQPGAPGEDGDEPE